MNYGRAVIAGLALVLAGAAEALVIPAVVRAQDTTVTRSPAPVRPQPLPAAVRSHLAPLAAGPGPWIGLAFNCRDCHIVSDDSTGNRWSFPGPVEVYSVEEGSPAFAAGIRRGDVLTHVAGRPLASVEAGRRWASLEAGDTVRVTYRRGASSIVTTLRPSEPRLPAAPARAPRPAQVAALRSAEAQHDSVLRLARRHEENVLRHQQTQELLVRRLAERSVTDEQRRALHAELQAHHAAQGTQLRRYLELQQRLQHENQQLLRRLSPTPAPHAPASAPQLRYSGTFAGTDVEVRGPSTVVITEVDGELVIRTHDTTVRLRVPRRN